MIDNRLLKILFEDADILDIDWSRWWMAVDLIVVADHAISNSTGRTMFLVSFQNVLSFRCTIPTQHQKSKAKSIHSWPTNGTIQRSHDGCISIDINGLAFSPSIRFECKDITIVPIDRPTFHKLQQMWRHSGIGFLRPSISSALTAAQEAGGELKSAIEK